MKFIIYGLVIIFSAGCITTNKIPLCRIGMTTDLDRRKAEWIRDYKKIGFKVISWKILAKGLSREDAQPFETRVAQKQKCISSPGGGPSGKDKWSIYKLEYSYFK